MTPQPKTEKVTQDEARLAFVRKMPCLIAEYAVIEAPWPDGHENCNSAWYSGMGWIGASEAHHVRKGSRTGLSRKPPASRTVPLCKHAHEEYHRIGHDTFCAKYGLDLEAHIERINAEFAKLPKREKRERKPSIRVKSIAVSCDCRLKRHGLKPIECEFEYDRVNFRCPVSRTMKQARMVA